MDEEILNFLDVNQLPGGSTACCALFKDNVGYVINLGDSRAVFVKRDNQEVV